MAKEILRINPRKEYISNIEMRDINPKLMAIWDSLERPQPLEGWRDESEFSAELKTSFTKRFWWHSSPIAKTSVGCFLFKDGTPIAGMILKRKKTLRERLSI